MGYPRPQLTGRKLTLLLKKGQEMKHIIKKERVLIGSTSMYFEYYLEDKIVKVRSVVKEILKKNDRKRGY